MDPVSGDSERAVPSAAAVEAAYREGCQHGGSFREEHGELVHVCACGATFRDDGVSPRDGDDLWQLHATECELRAAYAVDAVAPPGVTVARVAALLREWSADDDERQAGEDQLYTDDEWADALATWLAPRLGLGAPP